ncbi:MAG: hypothetical protein WCO00_03145 [Rhodospirillaceae bacterium]
MKRLLAFAVIALVASVSAPAKARECPAVTEVEVTAKCMQDAAASHPVAWCKKADSLAAARQKLIDEKIGMFDRALAAWNKDVKDSAPSGDAETTASYYQDALKDGLSAFKEAISNCRDELNRK